MRIEHFAYHTSHPVETANWYVEHFGFTIKRASDESFSVRFLADESGQVMLELYNNPCVETPHYSEMDPLLLHIAFSCDNIKDTIQQLTRVGATLISGPNLIRGDELAMLRDPWGFAIQLCKRGSPMVTA